MMYKDLNNYLVGLDKSRGSPFGGVRSRSQAQEVAEEGRGVVKVGGRQGHRLRRCLIVDVVGRRGWERRGSHFVIDFK
jgi:hypothetical protein